MKVYRVKERPVGGVESADLGWLMPIWRYDRDMSPYTRNKAEAEVFTERDKAQERADHNRGEVIEEER